MNHRLINLGIAILMLSVSVAAAQTDSKTVPRSTKAADTASAPSPVIVKNGVATLSPENSKIEFVGSHVGDQPDRLGGFSKFKGQVKLTDDGKSVSEIGLEFQMDSLWTLIPGLTTHLKTADFLDVKNHPTAKFVSTKVVAGDEPTRINIVGEFSLHGETCAIDFPAIVKLSDKGVVLTCEFKLDRTNFGMDKMTERVSNEVTISVSIGETTKVGGSPASPDAGSTGQRRAGRGMDVGAFFKGLDKDGDGKLTGDEIPERMKQGLSRIDTDGDGAVSLKEIQARRQQRRTRDGGK